MSLKCYDISANLHDGAGRVGRESGGGEGVQGGGTSKHS